MEPYFGTIACSDIPESQTPAAPSYGGALEQGRAAVQSECNIILMNLSGDGQTVNEGLDDHSLQPTSMQATGSIQLRVDAASTPPDHGASEVNMTSPRIHLRHEYAGEDSVRQKRAKAWSNQSNEPERQR